MYHLQVCLVILKTWKLLYLYIYHFVPASEREKEDEILAVGVANKTERLDGQGTARVEDSKDLERTQTVATAGQIRSADRTQNREVNLGGTRDTGDFSLEIWRVWKLYFFQ